MFKSARINLTAWYLFIIMLISVAFSVVIYEALTSEINRIDRIQRLRIEHRILNPDSVIIPPPSPDISIQRMYLDPDIISETKNRILIYLGIINLAILGSTAIAGYFLAGKTLQPIKEMVDEQNRFITDASHELRTPLTSLKSEIEVNLRDKKLSLTDAKKLLESNLEEVNNLQILSDDLIKLTQYQKGDNGLTVEKISMKSIIEESIKKVVNLAKSKKIVITNNIGDQSVEVCKPLLIELFVIFLDNAIKYSPKESNIIISTEKTDGHITVNISDEGMGINDDDIPLLFNRFYRSDTSRTKTDVPGYGLGLSIAKQIVDKHNGIIRVKSKLDKGTTFSVELPLQHQKRLIKI
jgi:two-component system, OmpR family, sensor histidine kinase CiaH